MGSPHAKLPLSYPFEEHADHFAERRSLPAAVARRVVDSAIEIVGPGSQILEVGVGPGLIARRLAASGMAVTGIDLSYRMLVHHRKDHPRERDIPHLIQADASFLPLPDRAFRAVISVHLLHLLPDWRAVIGEMVRVLDPHGVLLIGYEWRPADSPGVRLLARWQEIVAQRSDLAEPPAALDYAEIEMDLGATGARIQPVTVGEWTSRRSILDHLEAIEHRTWSHKWEVPAEFFPRCLVEIKSWAAAEFGDLSRETIVRRKFIWLVVTLNPLHSRKEARM